MRGLRRILSWIILSIIIQAAALAYINYIYLPGRGAVTASLYIEDRPAVKNRSIKLPKGAKEIKVSYDGVYVAYRLKDDLIISVIENKKRVKVLNAKGGEFTYYRWLQDRDLLIYATKESDGENGQVCISTYDIGSNLNRSYPVIKGLPADSEIIDIEPSPLTNIVYSMIRISDKRAEVYKFDIMDNLIHTISTEPMTIIETNLYSDNLIYQALNGPIKIINGNTGETTALPIKEANQLLAVDDKDFIYAAVADKEGSITDIHIGKAEQTIEDWRRINFGEPIFKSDIIIASDGLIYAVNRGDGTIQNIDTRELTEFEGELLAVTRDYAVSVKNGKLIMTALRK